MAGGASNMGFCRYCEEVFTGDVCRCGLYKDIHWRPKMMEENRTEKTLAGFEVVCGATDCTFNKIPGCYLHKPQFPIEIGKSGLCIKFRKKEVLRDGE